MYPYTTQIDDLVNISLFGVWANMFALNGLRYNIRMDPNPSKKILYPPNCTLSAFLAATWIHRACSLFLFSFDESMRHTENHHRNKRCTPFFYRISQQVLGKFLLGQDAGWLVNHQDMKHVFSVFTGIPRPQPTHLPRFRTGI